MSARPAHEPRVVWAFWAAGAVAAVGGAVPIVLAGPSGRISLVIVPFWVAAAVFAACALLQGRARNLAALLYFAGGLAIVYGIVAMLAVPLRLAVIGTCPTGLARCPAGLQQPMTDAENTGFAFAIGMGVVAIFVGFFGLIVLFRATRKVRSTGESTAPPVRRIPPVQSKPAVAPESAAPAAAPMPAIAQPTSTEPEEAAPRPMPELVAPVEELERPAHVEEPELPAHVSDGASDPAETASPPHRAQ